MKSCLRVAILFLACAHPLFSFAADPVRGRVLNQSTGRPANGDPVMLMGEGMQEQARSVTDSQGAFVLPVASSQARYVVRVLHQGVSYDQTVGGAAQLEIRVFNTVPKIQGLKGKMGIAQIGSDGKTVTVKEMYSVTNASNPPVTQANPQNFEISLPDKAILDSIEAKGLADSSWSKPAPNPVEGHNGRYRVNFPIRPGDTLFKFAYHLPYQGIATLRVRVPYPIEKFAVVHPPSLLFKSSKPSAFMSPGVVNGLKLEQATATIVTGELPAFQISGVGVTEPAAPPARSEPAAPVVQAAGPHRPATPPENPARKELWIMLSGISMMLVVIVAMVWRTRRSIGKRARAAQAQTGSIVLK